MHEMGLAKTYPFTKFDISSFTHSRFTEGGLKLKNWPRTLITPLLGYFVTHEMGHASVYPCTEFTVSSFTIPNSMEREGFFPPIWKSAEVIPIPKVNRQPTYFYTR